MVVARVASAQATDARPSNSDDLLLPAAQESEMEGGVLAIPKRQVPSEQRDSRRRVRAWVAKAIAAGVASLLMLTVLVCGVSVGWLRPPPEPPTAMTLQKAEEAVNDIVCAMVTEADALMRQYTQLRRERPQLEAQARALEAEEQHVVAELERMEQVVAEVLRQVEATLEDEQREAEAALLEARDVDHEWIQAVVEKAAPDLAQIKREAEEAIERARSEEREDLLPQLEDGEELVQKAAAAVETELPLPSQAVLPTNDQEAGDVRTREVESIASLIRRLHAWSSRLSPA